MPLDLLAVTVAGVALVCAAAAAKRLLLAVLALLVWISGAITDATWSTVLDPPMPFRH